MGIDITMNKILAFLICLCLCLSCDPAPTAPQLHHAAVARKRPDPAYPPEWRTDLKAWSADARWIFDLSNPWTASNAAFFRNIHIEAGAGWTPGTYGTSNYVDSYATGTDGAQNMLYLSSAPAAPGTTGGIGWIAGTYGTRHVVFYGDSITAGDSTSESPRPYELDADYPQIVINLIGSDYWRKFNKGYSGETAASLRDNYASRVPPCYDSSKIKNILVVWAGTNDIYFGASAATAYSNFKDICALGAATGFQVIAVNMLPRNDAGVPGGFESSRTAFNAAFAADFPTATADGAVFAANTGITFASFGVRVSFVSGMGAAGDCNSTTNYSADKVHPNPTGNALVAPKIKAAIDLLP